MKTISLSELSGVRGGEGGEGPTWAEFYQQQAGALRADHKRVVCGVGGLKGGPELAEGLYHGNNSDKKRILMADAVKNICNGGEKLPAGVPELPL